MNHDPPSTVRKSADVKFQKCSYQPPADLVV
jgi:hypothetical protein